MKKLMKYAIILAMVPVLFMTSCKKDEPDPIDVDYYAVMSDYMKDHQMDLTDLLSDWVLPASAVVDADNGYTIPEYHVLDIRAAADFEIGHIPGAVNIASANILTAAANYTDKPILVVCYSGQGAGHSVMALRLSGYTDAAVLKWGMSGWHSDFSASWEENSGHENGNIASGDANWVTTDAPANGVFENPTWTATATDGAGILAERVAAMVTAGFQGEASATVLADPGAYNIVNFWGAEDYITYGHFDGAFQVSPISIANDIVNVFDPESESLVYCYTGQTSSMATAWLNVLGFNVKSVKYGVNSLNYDELSDGGEPAFHGAEDYPYEGGAQVDYYKTLADYMVEQDLDLTDLLSTWVIAATAVTDGGIVDVDNGATIPDYHVFDIRAAADFATGHINGAINVASVDVVTTAAGYTDKPILVVCYSGQGAGHAVMALRLSGFADAQVLKWGMSGWHTDFAASWDTNAGHDNGNIAVGNANWVTTAAPAVENYTDPIWTSTATTGAEILAERVELMLTNGFMGEASATVLADPSAYQIVNFWGEADYLAFGHFAGAYQINPVSIEGEEVAHFDPAATSLIYCYTGQTSSMATAWLNVLGYNVKSVKYGVNSLNYDALYDAAKPTWHGAEDYEYVQ